MDLELTRGGPREPWQLGLRRGRMIALTDSVAVDAELDAFAAPYHAAAQAALAERSATAAQDIGSPRGRLADGPLWDLVHAAQLDATGADVSLAALFDPAARHPPRPGDACATRCAPTRTTTRSPWSS